MCEACRAQHEKDAKFWRTMRRALMMVASAIGDRYPESKQQDRRAA